MVRISQILCRARYHRRQKEVYRNKGIYEVSRTLTARTIVEGNGRVIHDAMTFINPPPEKWVPEVPLLPDFLNADLIEASKQVKASKPLEATEPLETSEPAKPQRRLHPALHLSDRRIFSEGVKQACLLTKAQKFDGLPGPIEQLIDKYHINNQNQRVITLIRHGQQWNNTKKMLPKRNDVGNLSWHYAREYGLPDTQAAEYLLHEFVRLAQTQSSQFPDLVHQRRVMNKPEIQAQYTYREDKMINISVINELLVLGREPLPAFGSEDLIQESVNHRIPDLYPICPTIDLEETHVKRSIKTALARKPLSADFHPQIILRRNRLFNNEHNLAFNIVATCGAAVAEARAKYGLRSGALEKPITIMNVNATHNTFNFLVFQLNTLDMNSQDGIKNFLWLDGSNKLFERLKPQPWKDPPTTKIRFTDFEEDVFKKFLAMFLYNYDTNRTMMQ